ncbi:MAG: hypothetical protein PHV59_09115 [Victivallales bacterium]|nr:hypothetical protein [Victivallales bacterium]
MSSGKTIVFPEQIKNRAQCLKGGSKDFFAIPRNSVKRPAPPGALRNYAEETKAASKTKHKVKTQIKGTGQVPCCCLHKARKGLGERRAHQIKHQIFLNVKIFALNLSILNPQIWVKRRLFKLESLASLTVHATNKFKKQKSGKSNAIPFRHNRHNAAKPRPFTILELAPNRVPAYGINRQSTIFFNYG